VIYDLPFATRHASEDPWVVFDFEVEMYFETTRAFTWVKEQLRAPNAPPVFLILRNTVTESIVLHTRVLVDILISKIKDQDDISLNKLSPEWCESPKGKELIKNLSMAYGNAQSVDSPCWVINKMLAHPTNHRANYFDYGSYLNKINGPIFQILLELCTVTNRDILRYYLK